MTPKTVHITIDKSTFQLTYPSWLKYLDFKKEFDSTIKNILEN